jgi:hypothetical protein|tara:strand:+ start:767 stop:1042 length:276 start_codon:yes stop_codon:yes gene_type:complete
MGAKQFAMVDADGTIHRHPPRDNQLTGDVIIISGTDARIRWLRLALDCTKSGTGECRCPDGCMVEVYKGTDHWYPVYDYDMLEFGRHSWPM